MKLTGLQLAACSIPLPRPIRLGPVMITSRDFVALRLLTESGIYGDAIGYPRGSALFDEVLAIAPFFLGNDAFERRSNWEDAAGRLVNTRAAILRALGLFDIAQADIMAKMLEQPLYKLHGAFRDAVPVMAVAGYYLGDRSVDDVVREVCALFDKGFARVKIMLSGKDPEFDRRYVEAVNAVAPGRVAADAHWSWNSVAEALMTMRLLDDIGLPFLEDPFGAHRNALLPMLAGELRTPLAAGEDMPSAEALLALCGPVKVLRVDATTCGGFTAALAVSEAAGLKGCAVLPHIFTSLHAQLAGVCPAITMVEHIPSDTDADPLELLLHRPLDIVDGILRIDQEPGAGMALDWTAVEQYAVRTATLEAAA